MPLVAEILDMEMTRVWLPVASMIPDDVERELRLVVGDAYQTLDELSRVILMLAHRFSEIGNEDIQRYRREHPRDIGNRLAQLVGVSWLVKADLFDGLVNKPNDSEHLPLSSEHYEELLNISAAVRAKGKVAKEEMVAAILALCAENWLPLRTLAQLLGRKPDSLRNHSTIS